MKLFLFLLRYARATMWLTVGVGIAGGLCSVALVALITSRLSLAGGSEGQLSFWRFSALVLAVLVALTDDIGTIANALLDVPNFCINFTITLGCVIYLGWLAAWMLPALMVF